MNDLEKRTLDMFKEVRDFDAAHVDLFPAGTLGRDQLDIIKEAIDDLEEYASAEAAGRGAARQGTVVRAAAKAAIIESLGIFRRTARAMSGVMPGVEERFPVLHKQDGQELINAARAALTAAESLKAEFARREVHESVYRGLEANIAAYGAALADQITGRRESHAAAASIDDTIRRGMNALHQLDAPMQNKLHHDRTNFAVWTRARHTKSAPRRNKKNVNNNPKPSNNNPDPNNNNPKPSNNNPDGDTNNPDGDNNVNNNPPTTPNT